VYEHLITAPVEGDVFQIEYYVSLLGNNKYLECYTGDILICIDAKPWIANKPVGSSMVEYTFLHSIHGPLKVNAFIDKDGLWSVPYLRLIS
jgi:hypothetical protein